MAWYLTILSLFGGEGREGVKVFALAEDGNPGSRSTITSSVQGWLLHLYKAGMELKCEY
jgi:hypothetical protein